MTAHPPPPNHHDPDELRGVVSIEQLRAKVQAWADKMKDPPTQRWPAWRVKPEEVLALLDVAEAARDLTQAIDDGVIAGDGNSIYISRIRTTLRELHGD